MPKWGLRLLKQHNKHRDKVFEEGSNTVRGVMDLLGPPEWSFYFSQVSLLYVKEQFYGYPIDMHISF